MPQPTDDPIADALERGSADLDELIARRRLGPRTPASLHDLEEEVRQLAAQLLAPFHGARPARPPMRVSERGAWW